MKLLEGKVTLITGASRGIGRGIALALAQHGSAVAFTYLSSPEKGAELEKELATFGVKAKGYRSDAADYKAAEELIASVLADFGKIDVVVNNAGITRDNLLMRMSEEHFDEVVRTNLKSVFNITKAVQKTMLKERKGSIINISSTLAMVADGLNAHYCASKAAVRHFTKAAALYCADRRYNIRVNSVHPGPIDDQGLAMVGVNLGEKAEKAVPFARKLGLSFPMLMDPEGAAREGYAVFSGLPVTAVVDRKGRLRHRVAGPLTGEALRALVEPLLRES